MTEESKTNETTGRIRYHENTKTPLSTNRRTPPNVKNIGGVKLSKVNKPDLSGIIPRAK